MEPKRDGTNRARIIAGVMLAAALVGGGAASYLVLGRGDDATGTNAGAADTAVMSAEEGAAARAEMDRYRAGAASGVSDATGPAELTVAADDVPLGCGPADGGELPEYRPTEEEIVSANADSDALAASFDTYGIAYERITDDFGFAYLTWDNTDVVAQSVHDSFWADRYPAQPPTAEELDRVMADNDVIARYLTEAGVAFTRTNDAAGFDVLEYDYEDPAAQEAVNAAYAELYPPVPPTPEELATVRADNDQLAAAFDAAGISYTRVSDEIGWEWLEWDYEDPDTQARVDQVFNELYPPMIEPCPALLGDAGDTAVDSGELLVDPVAEPTPEQVARRDAEASALAAGFAAAGVTHEIVGESPWQAVLFDLADTASVGVVAEVLASRA